jgi:hypothetical protein
LCMRYSDLLPCYLNGILFHTIYISNEAPTDCPRHHDKLRGDLYPSEILCGSYSRPGKGSGGMRRALNFLKN